MAQRPGSIVLLPHLGVVSLLAQVVPNRLGERNILQPSLNSAGHFNALADELFEGAVAALTFSDHILMSTLSRYPQDSTGTILMSANDMAEIVGKTRLETYELNLVTGQRLPYVQFTLLNPSDILFLRMTTHY